MQIRTLYLFAHRASLFAYLLSCPMTPADAAMEQ
jgi:hypothetical protein